MHRLKLAEIVVTEEDVDAAVVGAADVDAMATNKVRQALYDVCKGGRGDSLNLDSSCEPTC